MKHFTLSSKSEAADWLVNAIKSDLSAVIATAFVLFRCYIPHVSYWNWLGVAVWILVWMPLKVLAQSQSKQSYLFVCILLCLCGLSCTRIPITLGLLVSLPQFYKFANELKPVVYERECLEAQKRARLQLGLYPIYDYAKNENGNQAYLVTDVAQFISVDISGFMYAPSLENRGNAGRRELNLTHLWGDWYEFEEVEKF